jgi:hypothetical protein
LSNNNYDKDTKFLLSGKPEAKVDKNLGISRPMWVDSPAEIPGYYDA